MFVQVSTRLRFLRRNVQRNEQDHDEPDGRTLQMAHPYHRMTAFTANASPMIMMMSVIQSMERFRRAALGES